MNDKELLELAAKAVGYTVTPHANNKHSKDLVFIYQGRNWNPLTDDGDAFRLAVKLFFEIDVSNVAIAVRQPNSRLLFENVDSDSYAATRRAIVRAAAEIGKTK